MPIRQWFRSSAVVFALVRLVGPAASARQARGQQGPLPLTFAPLKATGTYAVGERVAWTVTLAPGAAV